MFIIIFLLGLIIGSFLNVVIFRLEKNQSFLFGRSACPYCGQKIAWSDNIPIFSFIILAGRCRHCQKKISWQYPALELATALIFLWLFFKFGLSERFFVYLFFAGILLMIFIYDLKNYLILDQITLPAIVFAFLANLYLGLVWWQLILAGVIGAVLGLILIVVKKKEMSSAVPFGPFLTFATLITLLYGKEILQWYLNLIYY